MTNLHGATAGPVQLRVSDREREAQAELLREHAGEGRLSTEELEERLDLTYAARTRGELAKLLDDLPAISTTAPAGDRRPRHFGDEPTAFVLINLVLIGIWAATGAGYFWPIWPLLGWGLGLAKRGHGLGLAPHARGGGCRAIAGSRREHVS